jgi:glycosyltransferase involved in cell wall biosynthesis
LDIILPCYNPPAGWAALVLEAIREIQHSIGQDVKMRIILINDGSRSGITDADIAALNAAQIDLQYLQYPHNQGKGHALRQGVAMATGEFQIYTDIDFPYTTASFVAVYAELATGNADIAPGVRDAEYYFHVPPIRRFISKFLRWMLRTFLRIKIADTQCGLKGFNARGRKVFLQTGIKRFLFDLEFIFLASTDDTIQMTPVPVALKPGIEFSKARIGILVRESLNFTSIFLRGIGNRLRRSSKS